MTLEELYYVSQSGEFVAVIEKARDTTRVVPWDVSALHGGDAVTPEVKPPTGTPARKSGMACRICES